MYIKDKQIIKYIGKTYYINYDMATGMLETNHENPLKYIVSTTTRGKENHEPIALILGYLVHQRNTQLHSFTETILTQKPEILEILFIQF